MPYLELLSDHSQTTLNGPQSRVGLRAHHLTLMMEKQTWLSMLAIIFK